MKLPRRPIRFVLIGLAVLAALGFVWLVLLDPLDRLAFWYSLPSLATTNGIESGMAVLINAPATAKPEDVLNDYLGKRLKAEAT